MLLSNSPGDLENEEEILEWLVDQLEKDEIEDVTDEMLDRLIKDGKTVAVLFCKYFSKSYILFVSVVQISGFFLPTKMWPTYIFF